MDKMTKQMEVWGGEFGKEYTDRLASSAWMDKWYFETFGITRTQLNFESIGHLDRSISILEVAANVGHQLVYLQRMGFQSLHGIELQGYAVELAKKNNNGIDIIQGSAFDIPHEDGSFDMVFTSGFLGHIAPEDIMQALKEIHRCAKKYIWGHEFFADDYKAKVCRGKEGILWNADFARIYLDNFNDLKLVNERKLQYPDSANVDAMFLLEKK